MNVKDRGNVNKVIIRQHIVERIMNEEDHFVFSTYILLLLADVANQRQILH